MEKKKFKVRGTREISEFWSVIVEADNEEEAEKIVRELELLADGECEEVDPFDRWELFDCEEVEDRDIYQEVITGEHWNEIRAEIESIRRRFELDL